MEVLGVVIAILALFGAPLASWVIVNRKIATLTAENTAMEKQFSSLEVNHEKDVKRLEKDYKERLERVDKQIDDHRKDVDENLKSIFAKMDANRDDILNELKAVTAQITELRIKIETSDNGK